MAFNMHLVGLQLIAIKGERMSALKNEHCTAAAIGVTA